MRGINKVILVGNLGDDPDTKYTQGGMAVTKVRMATTSVRKDRDGNTQERTEWHRVTFFGKLGEIAGEYLRKGSQVYVEGSIRYDKYTGQDGLALPEYREYMETTHLLIAAMAQKCRGLIEKAESTGGGTDDMPPALRPRHLLWMCDRVERHAADWPETKLHRWIGFVQCGMLADGMIGLAGLKAMFDEAKNAYGADSDDQDLIDHLDPDSSFEVDIGGQG